MSLYAALAEPSRRHILDLLRVRGRSVRELAARLDRGRPGVWKPLRVPGEAGLGEARAEGKLRWYGLRPEPLAEVADWLEPYRRHWSARLDALERHLEENPE